MSTRFIRFDDVDCETFESVCRILHKQNDLRISTTLGVTQEVMLDCHAKGWKEGYQYASTCTGTYAKGYKAGISWAKKAFATGKLKLPHAVVTPPPDAQPNYVEDPLI